MLQKRLIVSILTVFFVVFSLNTVFAEVTFPVKPITVIVPYGPGGGIDTFTRGLTSSSNKYLDQPIVISNVKGGGGSTGIVQVLNSKADGYTLLAQDVNVTTLQLFQEDCPFNNKSLEPIALAMKGPTWMLSPGDRPWEDIQGFVKAAKESPGKLKIGIAGPNSIQLLMGLAIKDYYDLDVTIIPYASGSDTMVSVLGGHADAVIIHSPMGLEDYKAGKIKIIASGAPTNQVVGLDKEVPILKDLGINDEFGFYRGIFAPAGIPSEVKDILVDVFKKMAKDEAFKNFGESWGLKPYWGPPEELRKMMNDYYDSLSKLKNRLLE